MFLRKCLETVNQFLNLGPEFRCYIDAISNAFKRRSRKNVSRAPHTSVTMKMVIPRYVEFAKRRFTSIVFIPQWISPTCLPSWATGVPRCKSWPDVWRSTAGLIPDPVIQPGRGFFDVGGSNDQFVVGPRRLIRSQEHPA
jgi:hypothetical protein